MRDDVVMFSTPFEPCHWRTSGTTKGFGFVPPGAADADTNAQTSASAARMVFFMINLYIEIIKRNPLIFHKISKYFHNYAIIR